MEASTSTTQPTKLRRYLLARHGETNFNKERRVQGTLDDPCVLTTDGSSQATALGMYVARRQVGDAMDDDDDEDDNRNNNVDPTKNSVIAAPPITRTWCSPLTRCRQTYAAVSGCCSSLPEPTIRGNLHEIDFREWQGRLRSEIIDQHSEQWNAFTKDPKQLRLNEGFAPVLDMWERGLGNWNAIRSDAAADGDGDGFKEALNNQNSKVEEEEDTTDVIFIMTHGAIGQCMLLQSLGISIDTYGKGRKYAFDNCECIEVEWMDGEECARRWRRVHSSLSSSSPTVETTTTRWQDGKASRKMASGMGLQCGRYDDTKSEEVP
mmetsp:Transcript_18998/g.35417  ORF Transcript_18998/g.35417 Transcript_18998/m.35417 type:complete len:321 (+) Transcript_18998:87-1049(+)